MSPLLEKALSAIRDKRPEARAQGVELIGVVGSVARGEARPDSDVDVLVDYLPGTTLLRIAQVSLDLESLLGRSVDLVDRKNLDERLRTAFDQDLVAA
jgi:predicted nucleotidyltransferase